MNRLTALVAPLLLSGCGTGEDSPSSSTTGVDYSSARFTQETTYFDESDRLQEETRGAFDWKQRRGWAEETWVAAPRVSWRQIGDDCYMRRGRGRWKHWQADDVDGTCDAPLFQNPSDEFDLIAQVSDLNKVGTAEIRGFSTTHYRGVLNIGAVQGPVELWVDDAEVVHRSRQSGEDGEFTSVRDYFDFGASVAVSAPASAITVAGPEGSE